MRIALSIAALVLVVPAAALQHPTDPHGHPDAAKLENPVKADEAALAAAKVVYVDQCEMCHGETGKGDGPAAPYAGMPLPSNLADAEWNHGSTDGEIFVVIRDGIPGTAMKDFKADLTDTQMWQLVHYIKTFAPKPVKGH
jgi:mono/diheme cytochrome c family protein